MESFLTFNAHVSREQNRWHENPAQHRNYKRRYEELCDQHGCRPAVEVPGFLEGGERPAKLPRVDGHYDMEEVSHVHVKRFNVSARRYVLHFRNMDNVADIDGTIEEVFDGVVDKIFQTPGNEKDKMGVEVRKKFLNYSHF